MRKKEPKEFQRTVVGFQLLGGTNAPHSFYLLYRVDFDDGSTKTERGNSVYALPGILKRGEKVPMNVRTDLGSHMRALQALLEPLVAACTRLDLAMEKKSARARQRSKRR